MPFLMATELSKPIWETLPEEATPATSDQAKARRAWIRILSAEVIGTFILTFVDAGAVMIDNLSGGQISYGARAIAPGLVVMTMIYTLGHVSGAHINPVATFAFALRGVFPRERVLPYWAAQIVGALSAAALLRLLFGTRKDVGATHVHGALMIGFAMEIALTFFLVLVILGTSTRHKNLGAQAAIAVGGTVAFCQLMAKPLTGPSMNPARSLGTALVSGAMNDIWVYLTAPFLGAALAVALTFLVHGAPKKEEDDAASGEEEK